MKKKIFFISLLTILLIGLATPKLVGADSGWDTSYDSGGSDWSSSSSSSDWSSSDSSGSSSGISYSEMTLGSAIIFEAFATIHYIVIVFYPIACLIKKYDTKIIIIFLLLLRIIILTIMNSIYVQYCFVDFAALFIFAFTLFPISLIKRNTKSFSYKDLPDDKLKEFGITDKESLKQELFKKYVDIQNAWMNFDYDKLKELLSDSLFNTYKQELKVLELKKQKNIMSDFKYIDSKIYNVSKKNNVITLELYLNIKMYDYVVDNNDKLLKGSKKSKVDIHYNIVFEKSSIKLDNKCPNCGAEITNNESNECPYCKAVIVKDSEEFVMCNKRNIGQN